MNISLIKAIRPLNLILILSSQILSVYFLGFKNSIIDIFNTTHLALYSVTLLCLASGNLFNAYFYCNPSIDSEQNDSSVRFKNKILISAMLFVIGALLISFLSSYKLGVIAMFSISVIFLYNSIFKKIPLIGNIILAVLYSFPIFMLMMFDSNLKSILIIVFSIFTFGIQLINAILFDAENIEKDRKLGFNSFPILAGIKSSRIFLLLFLFIFILVVTTCVRLIVTNFFSPPLSNLFIAYNILCVGFPLFHLLLKLQTATEKSDFVYLRKVICYTAITGTLSMMFF